MMEERDLLCRENKCLSFYMNVLCRFKKKYGFFIEWQKCFQNAKSTRV